jgi:hypothetical protein
MRHLKARADDMIMDQSAEVPLSPFPTLSFSGVTAVDLAAMNEVADTDSSSFVTHITGTSFDGAD